MSVITDIPDFILLNVGFSELNACWNWKKVYSPFARIYYVVEGGAKTYIGNRVYNLKQGHLYLTPPFTLHDDESDSLFSLYYIHFYENIIDQESLFDRFDFPIEVKASELDLCLIQRLLGINPNRHLRYIDPEVYDNPPTFSEYMAENKKMPVCHIFETHGVLCQLVSKFLVEASIKTQHKDSRINNALKYIHEHIKIEISMSELANNACITEDHFTRLFSKAMHCTPIKYINQKKMEKAQLLLLTTDMTVRSIAFEFSIDNISYFNRLFKNYTGMTPSAYRQKYIQDG